jgi:dTDP-4-dehydrorhamnose 3,5-epimerase
MEIEKTGFKGLIIVRPSVFKDSRGYFFESFNSLIFNKNDIAFSPVQDNESKSSKGVVRGLHYQLNPAAQAKLIRVVEGKIFDVAVDLRKDSPTYGEWFGVEIDSDSKEQVFIPKGFAHGFSVLSEIALIQYKCDNVYTPNTERGINLKDPDLNIDWQIPENKMIISDKDLKLPFFRNAEYNF